MYVWSVHRFMNTSLNDQIVSFKIFKETVSKKGTSYFNIRNLLLCYILYSIYINVWPTCSPKGVTFFLRKGSWLIDGIATIVQHFLANFFLSESGAHWSKLGVQTNYTVKEANADSTKNMLLLKNLQFLPNHNETLSKWDTHEYLIFTKFRNNWVKIVDFWIKAHFWSSPHSPIPVCTKTR